MSGSNAKPIRVAVIAADGTLLGYVNRKPHNANWRMLGRCPRVKLTKSSRTQECVSALPWQMREGWAARLGKDETTPQDMEAP